MEVVSYALKVVVIVHMIFFMIGILAFSPVAYAKPLSIQLCLSTTNKKIYEWLEVLLELELLLEPNLETVECSKNNKISTYLFRQEVRELDPVNAEKGRIEVKSALYTPSKKPIFGQIEFMKKPSRNAMNERAKSLSEAIIKAVSDEIEVVDPFFVPPEASFLSKDEPIVDTDDMSPNTQRALPSEDSTRNLGFFLGMERLSQLGFTETFLRSRELVVTKSILVFGANFVQTIASLFVLDIGLRGGASPLELLRPLALQKPKVQKISKLFDARGDFGVNIPLATQFYLTAYVAISGFYFDSDIAERAPLAPMSTYWQLKEGINVSGTALMHVFDSRVSLIAGFFPFIQNSSIKSWRPLNDYGWHLGFCAESTVYRSFGLKFMFDHRRELFDGVVSDQPIRLSSQGTLVYLGFTGKL